MQLTPVRRAPDTDRLSVIIAAVMLAYAVSPFINLAPWIFAVQLPGFYLEIPFEFTVLTSMIASVLAASGMQWLLTSHPHFIRARRARHWILPALTAWIIGVPLNILPSGLAWWAVFLLGSLFLAGVLIAEYIASEPSDPLYAAVTALLGALSLALFLLLAIALRGGGLRLFLILPAIAAGAFLVTLRTLYLQAGERWIWSWPAGVSLVVTQVAAGLHYWRISPVQYGVTVSGLLAALVAWAVGWENSAGRPTRSNWLESLALLGLSILAAMLLKI